MSEISGALYRNITESGQIKSGVGKIYGFTVNSHSSGTLALFDGLETGAVATTTLTSSGAMAPAFHATNTLTSSGAMVAGTHAVTVFTSSGVVVEDQTITIGTTVYRARPAGNMTQAYDVSMGASAQEFLANLRAAINGTYTATQAFLGTVVHPNVVASASDATTITLRGRVPGTSLNTVATTETFTNGSFPDTTLGGGTGASDAGVTTGAATVTLGSITYTVVDALSESYGATAVPYQVVKGAAEANMLDNLKLAINGTGTAGTHYSTGTTAHPYLIATTNTDTTQIVRARAVGDATYTATINALATTETMANTAWADTTMGGGTGACDPSVATTNATFTLDDRTYTMVLELSETSGATAVADQILWVTSEAVALDNIKAAINGSGVAGTGYSTGTLPHATVVATTNTNTTQVFNSRKVGTAGNSIVTTETLDNYAFTSTVMASGTGTNGRVICSTYTPATGSSSILFAAPINFVNGLYATIGGTSADITILYN